eukprot:5833249-Pyramimonas_sp.AAC.1
MSTVESMSKAFFGRRFRGLSPTCSAWRSVLLPWNPPPTIIVTPLGTPMPRTTPALGSVNSRASDGGDAKGTAS